MFKEVEKLIDVPLKFLFFFSIWLLTYKKTKLTCTNDYIIGWGQSFHFARLYKGKKK